MRWPRAARVTAASLTAPPPPPPPPAVTAAATMPPKAKAKKKRAARAAEDLEQAEAREELAALALIYEDFTARAEGGFLGFSVLIVPHPGNLEINHVAVTLEVALPRGYPDAPAALRLAAPRGLAPAAVKATAKRLHALAAAAAAAGEAAGFQLIQACQEALQDLNVPAAPTLSLFEEMQAREGGGGGAAAGSVEPSFGELGAADFGDGGLFEDADEAWAAATALPALRRTASPAVAAPTAAAPPPLPPAGSSAARSASDAAPSFSMSSRVLALGRAVLPRALLKLVQPAVSDESEEGGEEGEAEGGGDGDGGRAALRRELLLGRLLLAQCGAAELPAVAGDLAARGLLPKWLAWALSHQPALVERAFRRLAAEEAGAGAGAPAAGGDPAAAAAIARFWRPGGAAAAPAAPPPAPAAAPAAPPASRYAADFVEVRPLGRGAFGTVSLAVNRFDGREYAVKRVALERASAAPAALARIMREVTTLSRLQHPSVVRYYQAWIEEEAPGAGGEEEEPSDSGLAAWAGGADSSSSGDAPSGCGASSGSSSGGGAPTLAPGAAASGDGDSSLGLFAAAPDRAAAAVGSSAFTFDRAGGDAASGSSAPTAATATLSASPHAAGAAAAGAPRRVLYIAMEYCASTLRALLDAGGPPDEAGRWRALRQLLAGLAHIHA